MKYSEPAISLVNLTNPNNLNSEYGYYLTINHKWV